MELTPKKINYKVVAGVLVSAYIGFVLVRSLVNRYQVSQIKEQNLVSAGAK